MKDFDLTDHTALVTGSTCGIVATLAMALAPHRSRVNGIAPGLICTPLANTWTGQKPALARHYGKKVLLGRPGGTDDLGGSCVSLCSDAARYVTGQTLMVAGGLTVGQIGSLER